MWSALVGTTGVGPLVYLGVDIVVIGVAETVASCSAMVLMKVSVTVRLSIR